MAERDPPQFVIEAAEAEARAAKLGLSVVDLLPTLVPAAQSRALPPISNFRVGAVGLGFSGRVYLGANLEFPHVPLNQSVHAEQFLVSHAAGHGETGISHVAVSAVPCGHCRQFFQELRRADQIKILVTSDGPDSKYRDLSDLIPKPFGPMDLLHVDRPLLMEPQNNELILSADVDGNGHVAVKFAETAYAPYSGCPSGFAVADVDGRVYGGAYAESAAYNPSLGPVQAALVAYVASGARGFDRIVEAALVEIEGAVVSHEWTARMLMASVAPRCHVSVYKCRSS